MMGGIIQLLVLVGLAYVLFVKPDIIPSNYRYIAWIVAVMLLLMVSLRILLGVSILALVAPGLASVLPF
jgi:hypothetical protein